MSHGFEDDLDTALLAEELGITVDELQQLHYTIDENASNEGLIYNYIIQFDDECPREMLDKINGLTDMNSVNVSVNVFDRPDDEHLI
jgi:hypothetical protein